MKRIIPVVIGLLALFPELSCMGQPATDFRPDKTVFLYASEVEGLADPVMGKELVYAGFEMKESNGITEPEIIRENGVLLKVGAYARFDLYFPEKPNGQMILILPGGGYSGLSTYVGAIPFAEYLVGKGITAAVVKYRMPNRHPDVPLADVQNVMRYCRANASGWGVRSIGVMGMSAGGHLAASAATMYTDSVTRPDFAVLLYPVISLDRKYGPNSNTRRNLVGYEEGTDVVAEKYSPDRHVTPQTPPTFIAMSADDKMAKPLHSLLMYGELVRNGVFADLHIYPTGGHSWCVLPRTDGKERFTEYRAEFQLSFSRFLSQMNAQGCK